MVWEPCQIFEISQFMDFGFLFRHLLWQVKKSLQFFTERDRLCNGSWINFIFSPQSSCIKNWPESFYMFFSPWQSASFHFVHMSSEILLPYEQNRERDLFIIIQLSKLSVFLRQTMGCLALLGKKRFSFSTFCPFSTN